MLRCPCRAGSDRGCSPLRIVVRLVDYYAIVRGRGLWKENERVRLAVCPGVNKIVRFYESLSLGQATSL